MVDDAYNDYLPTTNGTVGDLVWTVPFPGVIRWAAASTNLPGVNVVKIEVYDVATSPVVAKYIWNTPTISPIPVSGSAGIAPGFPVDFNAAIYEPSGTLIVTSGDEIRVFVQNTSGAPVGLSVSVGVIFTSNTGFVTVNSFPEEYRPK